MDDTIIRNSDVGSITMHFTNVVEGNHRYMQIFSYFLWHIQGKCARTIFTMRVKYFSEQQQWMLRRSTSSTTDAL